MDFAELMRRRWSCRAFREEEVPRGLLDQVFQTAQRTASWCNAQPWQVHLMHGETTRGFARRLVAHVSAEPESGSGSGSGSGSARQTPDLPLPAAYEGPYLERRRSAGYALYASLGIDRSDYPARRAAMIDNYSFFGAPHVAIITTDRRLGAYGAIDCGAYVANLMNAALDVGIASIAQGAIGVQAGKVRELLGLPEDRLVVCGVAIGYADEDHPVNGFRTSRAGLDEAMVSLP